MTRAEILARLTAEEFNEWQLFDAVEPFGDRRADLQLGILCATVVNLLKSRGSQAAKPEDFIPKFEALTAAEAAQREAERMHQQFMKFRAGYDRHQQRINRGEKVGTP